VGGRPAGIVLTPASIDAPERLVALPVRATGWVGALAFLIVIASAALQYAAIAFFVLPRARG
jgi:hypothetical protein